MGTEKQRMNRAIITLTKGGMELGLKLLNEYRDSVLYINDRFDVKGERIRQISGGIGKLIPSIFSEYKCLIFIMATGIVVRSIAPHLENKAKDPAVIVMDEGGRNVISLLSGHLGRANEITLDIAKILNSNPVITTASDVNNSLAVDTLAIKLNCIIENLKDATKITAHIVNGERVGILSRNHLKMKLPHNVVVINNNSDIEGLKGIIQITNENGAITNKVDTVLLRPRNIIIGIGCKKGKTEEEIIRAVRISLDRVNKSELSIKHIATIDVKKDEKGILDTADYFKVPIIIVPSEDIKSIEDRFKTSDFVKKSIGVGAVAEPVALISSSNGNLILEKSKYDGITIAIVEEGGV